jgi:hypothetical protein
LRREAREKLSKRGWNVEVRLVGELGRPRKGPAYLKIGGKVLYRLEDLREYEKAHIVQARAET